MQWIDALDSCVADLGTCVVVGSFVGSFVGFGVGFDGYSGCSGRFGHFGGYCDDSGIYYFGVANYSG